jgi:hypothetical protein
MRPRSLPAKPAAPHAEHERRHYAHLIEAMSKLGRSEREIVAALEQAMATKRSVR